jgi:hypothetical protein
MAGGTLLIIALPRQRSDGRWLRRQVLRARSSYCQREVESRQLITQFFAAAESQEARQHSHK